MGKFKGYILAAFAAAAYGTNPAFAIPLYEAVMNPSVYKINERNMTLKSNPQRRAYRLSISQKFQRVVPYIR